jgi:soluble lytic murein transglycosylase-like protein
VNFIQIIAAAAKSVKISGAILVAICSHESGLNNTMINQDHGSPTYGICMVKYETASMLGYEGEPEGLMDPQTNAKYAAIYLKYQYKRYQNWCKAIAAYNAGRYKESQVLPGYPRNLKYVRHVQKRLNNRLKKITSCDIIGLENTYVAKNNGSGL